jgi:adenosylcobyric acid synthase
VLSIEQNFKDTSMTAVCIMVLGTTSNAGKSWLATALCRYYANLGFRVAPFKAQNMSNNARVVGGGEAAEGGEIGSAQYFQALAARAIPDVRMNPLLLKPEADTHSQVVLLGQVNQTLTDLPWRGRSELVWPHIVRALDALRAENDIVVIEGAGSPAEINLMDSDIVNLRVARYANARCLLVTDIDRGGAFAHLYGTWALMPEQDRALIHGFVLNKFRGDASLLSPAPEQLEALTGISTVATLPMWREHGLPEEDGVFDDGSSDAPYGDDLNRTTIAVVAYPRISNLDEFQPLKNVRGVRLIWVRSAAQLAALGADDWIILPGSKNTESDLAWLKARGLDVATRAHAARAGRVLGICGGLQMLGEMVGNATGLGLLPLETVFEKNKLVKRTMASFGLLHGAWQALSNVTVTGYEIHQGITKANQDKASEPIQGLAWQSREGNVLGIYLHGMFEDSAVLQALWGADAPSLDSVFEGLANFLYAHVDTGVLSKLVSKLAST